MSIRGGGAGTDRRIGFTATLMLAMALGTCVAFVLGALAPFITADLGLSRARFGLLSTLFFAVGAAGSPIAGPLVDRLGGRRMLAALFAAAGVALAGMAAAPTFAWLAAAIAAGGVATAVVNPVTNQLVSAHVPRGRQGAITGVKQSGVQVAVFAAGALLPPAALAVGWRGAVLASASLAVVGLAATRLVPASGAAARPRQAERPRPRLGGFVGWLAAYALLMGAGVSAVGVYLVLYGVEAVGLGPAAAGMAAAMIGLVGIGARIGWGWASERLASPVLSLAVLAGLSVVAQGLVWAAAAAGPWLLWVGAGGLGASAAAWNAVGMLAIVREIDPAATGRASGLVQLGFYLGMLAAPATFGWTVDVTGDYGTGWAGVTVAFAAATAVAGAWHVRRRAAPSAAASPTPTP